MFVLILCNAVVKQVTRQLFYNRGLNEILEGLMGFLLYFYLKFEIANYKKTIISPDKNQIEFLEHHSPV